MAVDPAEALQSHALCSWGEVQGLARPVGQRLDGRPDDGRLDGYPAARELVVEKPAGPLQKPGAGRSPVDKGPASLFLVDETFLLQSVQRLAHCRP